MHKLAREIRFSVNPFLEGCVEGFNSYASKPCGEGLALYFNLWIELAGEVDGDTGFVVNVTDIDKAVRSFVVPIFDEKIKEYYGKGEHVGLSVLCGILRETWSVLKDKFGTVTLSKMVLGLNPFRKITIKSEDCKVFYFSEKFEFAAMHTLWNDKFSDEENFKVFGKCANPAGHGHNYVVEVTVKRNSGNESAGWIGGFEKVVEDEFMGMVDHKNLNADVAEFGKKNPTVENIASFAWGRLNGKFGQGELTSVTVWETDRTYCTYSG